MIYNEDCFETMKRLYGVDIIMTSPPYNMTSRKGGVSDKGKYDVYRDWKSKEEYLEWIVALFNSFDRILNKQGVVLFNFSYSIENPALPYELVTEVVRQTNFVMVDTIVWKKPIGVPFPANRMRLSRIFEYIFVFVKRESEKDFMTNREVVKVSPNGQKYYNVVYNYVEAKNNDGVCPYNKATYSSDLVLQMLSIYCGKQDAVVYDPFMGSGTTAIGVKLFNRLFGRECTSIGSEISQDQCRYAEERIEKFLG